MTSFDFIDNFNFELSLILLRDTGPADLTPTLVYSYVNYKSLTHPLTHSLTCILP